MEALILERLEESIDALFVAVAEEFRKVIDEIHLDKEKEEQFAIKVFDSAEAIRERKNLHHSGRWGKEQHRVVFYNRKIDECSWFVQNLLVSNTPRSLKDGEIRHCAELLTRRTNALIKKIRVIDSFREVNLRIFLQSAFNRRVAIPVLLHLRIAVQRKDYDVAEHYLRLAAPGLVFFEHLFADEETPLAEDEENAATDETDAVKEDDSEDAQPEEFSSENQARVRDTLEMWEKMSEITRRNREDDKMWPADNILRRGNPYFVAFSDSIGGANEIVVLADEIEVRRIICKIIDAIPGFRESEKFKELIELYPTYKERLQ